MFLRRLPLLAISSLACLVLCGCRHITHNFGSIPPPPIGFNNSTDFNKDCIAAAAKIETDKSLDDEDRRLARNRAISVRLMAVRQTHAVYVGRVAQHRAGADTISDLLLAAGTAVSAINPGTAIGATNVALVAGKASVDKNFFDDLSRSALLIDIYKNSQTAEKTIVDGFSAPYKDYSMSKACSDIDAFFYAASATNAVGAAGVTLEPKGANTTENAPNTAKGSKPTSTANPSTQPTTPKPTSPPDQSNVP